MLRVLTLAALTLGLVAGALSSATAHDGPLVPLPAVTYPLENPPLPSQDVLGKVLFWDEQLSHDNSVACGTCHRFDAGGADPRVGDSTLHPGPDGLFGTDDDIVGSPGMTSLDHGSGQIVYHPLFGTERQVTRRLAPSVINSAFHETLFWDGRATGAFVDPQTGELAIAEGGALESQAVAPILSPNEMSAAGRTWDDVISKLEAATPLALATDIPPDMAGFLAENPTYPDMFAAVYGTPQISARRVAFAIANYERTLVSDETIVDDLLRGDIDMLPTQQMQNGWELFHGDAMCHSCHEFPATSGAFHNIGVRPDDDDIGRMAVTGDPLDKGRFKTPGLRNASLKARMFHNGSAVDLKGAIDIYADGGFFNDGNLDPLITPLVETLNGQDLLALRVLIRDGLLDQRVANGEFPFTRPTLRSELPSLTKRYGTGTPSGSGRRARWVVRSPANLGNEHFLLGLGKAIKNTPVTLLVAHAADRDGSPLSPEMPVPVFVDLATLFIQFPLISDDHGVAGFSLPLNADPIVVGTRLYAQWLIDDPTQLETGGVYATGGLAIEIF